MLPDGRQMMTTTTITLNANENGDAWEEVIKEIVSEEEPNVSKEEEWLEDLIEKDPTAEELADPYMYIGSPQQVSFLQRKF